MKRRNVWTRRGHRYLRREAKAGRLWPYGYTEVQGAIMHTYGTTHAAERRHWPYWVRWTQPELDQAWRDLPCTCPADQPEGSYSAGCPRCEAWMEWVYAPFKRAAAKIAACEESGR